MEDQDNHRSIILKKDHHGSGCEDVDLTLLFQNMVSGGIYSHLVYELNA
jgi:hypothetical protein